MGEVKNGAVEFEQDLQTSLRGEIEWTRDQLGAPYNTSYRVGIDAITPSGRQSCLAPPDFRTNLGTGTTTFDREASCKWKSLKVEKVTDNAEFPNISVGTDLAILAGAVHLDVDADDSEYSAAYDVRFIALYGIGGDDLAIDHIQVVQVSQTPENKAKLIKNKTTIARVFVKSVGTNAKRLDKIDAELRVGGRLVKYSNGRVFADRTVSYVDLGIYPPGDRSYYYVNGFESNSFDFPIPDTSLDTLDLSARVWIKDDKGVEVKEQNETNNRGGLAVTLEPQGVLDPFRVGYAPVCVKRSDRVICPSDPASEQLNIDPSFPVREMRLQRIPFPKLVIDAELFDTPEGVALATLTMIKEYRRVAALSSASGYFGFPEPDQMIFNVADVERSADDYFGAPGGLGQYWWVPTGCRGTCVNTIGIAHGIAHNYGLVHYGPMDPNPFGEDKNAAQRRSRVRRSYIPKPGDGSWSYVYNRVMDFNRAKEAGNYSFKDDDLSIAPGEYNALHAAFLTQRTNAVLPRAAGEFGETAVISGSVSRDGSTGTLDPAFHGAGNAPIPASNPSGDTCLRFTPAGSDYCFNVTLASGARNGYFAVATPFPAGTQRVALRRSGRELASIATGTPPQVSFLSPAAGETWDGVRKIRWSSTGPRAIFRLEYSPDGGASWLALSTELTVPEYDFDTADILGGSITFRVTAAAGLDNASAVSPPVQIAQSPRQELPVTSVTFGNVRLGNSASEDVIIRNTGTGQLQVNLTAPSNPAFALETATTLLIPGGQSGTARIRFAPVSAGSQQSVLRVGSQDVALRGSAFDAPAASLDTSAAIDLGDVQAGRSKEAPVFIRNPGDAPLTVTSVSISGSGFTLSNAGTPFTVEPRGSAFVTARVTGGSAGTLSGLVTINSNDPARAQAQVAVSARVVSGVVPAATAAGVLNAASFVGGGVAPGEIVTIFGTEIGPPALAGLQLDGKGKVSSNTGETRVLFDDIPAPIVYTLAGQTSVVVPYAVANRGTTEMVIERQGRRSDPVVLTVLEAAPALFSANSSGSGPGAILNQNGSINTPQNQAAKGSVVVFFGTGEGDTSPAVADGSVTAGVVSPRLPVGVTIGGVAQRVLYAGAAPGLVAGVLQLNVEIAANTPTGNQPVIVTVGTATSPSGLTVAIAGASTPAPSISVTPTSLDFGSVTVGQTRDLTLAIRNSGTATLTVSSIASSNARFANISGALSIAAGATQNATIRFSPTAAGSQTGTLTISSNAPSTPAVSIGVTGTGAGAAQQTPVIDATPGTLDFGSVAAGQSRDLTLTIRNAGTATLTVTSSISSNARFALVGLNTPFSLAAGASQNATVRFSPTAAGSQTGTIAFASNDPATPTRAIAVNGTGTGAAAPAIAAEPGSLDFGTVAVGQSKELTIVIRNTGGALLTVTGVTSTNARFAFTGVAFPFSIGAGLQQTATVRFTPSQAAAETGTLTFASNDPARPALAVPLSGNTAGGGPIPINVGDTVQGTLTTMSAPSTGCPLCFAVVYRLVVTTARGIDVNLTSTAFDSYLQILDGAGNILAEDDDSGELANARIVGTFQPGTYFIEVTSAFEGEVGPYTLSLSPVP